MTQPKISLHDALRAIHEHFDRSGHSAITIKMNAGCYSPYISVGYESNFVCNPSWEPGLYERELGFPEFISEPEKVEKVQEEETKVKKFVVFDNKGCWSTTVNAESLEKALELVTEDVEGDYAWENGCSVNVGEVVFEGKIKAVAVSNVVEALDTKVNYGTIGELPVGTILEALVDCPVSILSLKKGGLAVVCDGGHCKLLSDTKQVRNYGSGYSLKNFNQTWKIVYKP
jgi:hypothetical protein